MKDRTKIWFSRGLMAFTILASYEASVGFLAGTDLRVASSYFKYSKLESRVGRELTLEEGKELFEDEAEKYSQLGKEAYESGMKLAKFSITHQLTKDRG